MRWAARSSRITAPAGKTKINNFKAGRARKIRAGPGLYFTYEIIERRQFQRQTRAGALRF